jgi:hypothetical protein
VIPISNQDGRQAKNRKKGDEIFFKSSPLTKFGCGGHLGRRSEMPDTILEGDHPMIISAKLG